MPRARKHLVSRSAGVVGQVRVSGFQNKMPFGGGQHRGRLLQTHAVCLLRPLCDVTAGRGDSLPGDTSSATRLLPQPSLRPSPSACF